MADDSSVRGREVQPRPTAEVPVRVDRPLPTARMNALPSHEWPLHRPPATTCYLRGSIHPKCLVGEAFLAELAGRNRRTVAADQPEEHLLRAHGCVAGQAHPRSTTVRGRGGSARTARAPRRTPQGRTGNPPPPAKLAAPRRGRASMRAMIRSCSWTQLPPAARKPPPVNLERRMEAVAQLVLQLFGQAARAHHEATA